jgi:hypothetical protein
MNDHRVLEIVYEKLIRLLEGRTPEKLHSGLLLG